MHLNTNNSIGPQFLHTSANITPKNEINFTPLKVSILYLQLELYHQAAHLLGSIIKNPLSFNTASFQQQLNQISLQIFQSTYVRESAQNFIARTYHSKPSSGVDHKVQSKFMAVEKIENSQDGHEDDHQENESSEDEENSSKN